MASLSLQKNTDLALYAQVENLIKSGISDGTFLPGTKIPSVREMSRKLDVSISTVMQAYALLETRGYVEVRPQSGYFVKPLTVAAAEADSGIKSKAVSAPRFVQKTSRHLDIVQACSNEKLVPLGGATIHQSMLPIASLQKSLLNVVRNHPEQSAKYTPIAGYAPLCREIAKRSVASGFRVKPEGVVITNGCTEALYLALKACTVPGDIVAVESPTYHGILRLIEDLGLKILELATSADEGIDLKAFEEKAQKFKIKAALLTPNFLNPLGSLMSDENKKKLVQIGYKYDITLIEDDIYTELYFTSKRPTSLKAYDEKDKNYLCSSFSKTLSAGYRIGWVIPPEEMKDQILLLKSTSSYGTNGILQMALADHLVNHSYDRHLRRLRQNLNNNMYLFKQAIRKYFPEDIKMTNPQGGCLIWIEFPNSFDATAVYEKALKKNISIIPGEAFSSSGKYTNCLRINIGVPWSKDIEKALMDIADLCKS